MPAEALAQSRELRQLRLTGGGIQSVTPDALALFLPYPLL
jgi:hypothetical protein